MRTSASISSLRPFVGMVVVATLAGCGDSGGGVTTPTPTPTTPACQSTLRLTLAVGETRPLTSEQAACFTIQSPGSTRYVLAGFDTRAVDAAQRGPEPSLSSAPTYTLGSGDAPSMYATPSEQGPASDVTV